jgi:transposase
MGTKKSSAPVFKPYDPDQLQLLPPSLDELIAENHPARIVKNVIDEIDIRPINRRYKGGGASSYHPRMLLKVLGLWLSDQHLFEP